MDLGFLPGELSATDQFADERVVVRQLFELVVADAVGAGVADMAEGDAAVSASTRATVIVVPMPEAAASSCALVHAPIRLLDQLDDVGLAVAAHVRSQSKRVDREAGRDLPALRAAHPVRDREERRLVDVGVLVVPPLATRVREVGGPQSHCSNLRSVSPTRITSPDERRLRAR